VARFDWRQLLVGHGDHWVGGGALAISALAAGTIALAAKHLGIIASTPEIALLAIWAAAVVIELIRPRVRYDVHRWATVFPLGMFASCSFVIGDAVGADGITRFARGWSWVAFAVWLVVLVAAASSGSGDAPLDGGG
jgi:voltage-gated anion channel